MLNTIIYLKAAERLAEDLRKAQEEDLTKAQEEDPVKKQEKKKLPITIDQNWIILFELGSILPSALVNCEDNRTRQKMLNVTHFRDILKDGKHFLHFPGLKCFQIKYGINLNDPLMLGYYVHLYLDKMLKNGFYGKYYRILKKNGYPQFYFEQDRAYLEKRKKGTHSEKTCRIIHMEELENRLKKISLQIDLSRKDVSMSDSSGQGADTSDSATQTAQQSSNFSQDIQEILKHLDAWLTASEDNCRITCPIEEIRQYDLKEALTEEIARCRSEAADYNKSVVGDSDAEDDDLLINITQYLGMCIKQLETNVLPFTRKGHWLRKISGGISVWALLLNALKAFVSLLLFIVRLPLVIVRLIWFVIRSLFLAFKDALLFLYRNMYKRGCVSGICYTVKTGVKKSFRFLIRKPKESKITVNDQIYEKWKNMWTTGFLYDAASDYFYPLFIEAYDYVKGKTDYNRKMNFFVKKIYLAIIMMFPLGATGVFLAKILFEESGIGKLWETGDKLGSISLLVKTVVDKLSALFGNQMDLGNAVSSGVILFLFVVVARIIAKWLDIKKYQETWVRHANHKYKLDQEMFKYVQNLDPYKTTEMQKRTAFINNVMAIWDENQQKFVKNMDEREKEMTDMLDHIGK